MKILNDYRINRALALLWMMTICFLSSQSDLPAPSIFPAQDKLEHLLAFGILGILLGRSFKSGKDPLPFKQIILITIMVTIYGGLDEIHQMFVPNRCVSLGDLMADAAGGFLGGAAFYYLPIFHAGTSHTRHDADAV